MSEKNINELLKQIEQVRKEMHELYETTPLTDDKMIQISTKLDSLLNELQELKNNGNNKS